MLESRTGTAPVVVDACVPCQLVWFDCREGAHVAPAAGARPPADADVFVDTLESMLHSVARADDGGRSPANYRPVATRVLAAVVAAAGLLALTDPKGAADALGLIPDVPFRLGGLTWITSSFVHGNAALLLVNVGFLWGCGGKAEAGLGPGRLLGLIATAELVGKLVHVLLGAGPELPCVGISGGVLAATTFYALRFPGDRIPWTVWLGRGRWPRWRFELSAWSARLSWLLFRGLLALLPGAAHDLPALAQGSSALVGIGFWLRGSPRAER